MLVSGSCPSSNCFATHCTYGVAIHSYMSHEPPARLPDMHDGLTTYFKPSLFEVASLSPYHSADAFHQPSESSTAVLPLPITHKLLLVYKSPAFFTDLLDRSGLLESDVRLLTARTELQLSSGSRYGLVVLTGPSRRVHRAIDAVIEAVESSAVSSQQAVADMRVDSTASFRSPARVCPWGMMSQAPCDRIGCVLPDEAHDRYIDHLMRNLDTTSRLLAAIPPFCSSFSFVVCRTPSADSTHFLCSLCVPNTGRARGYVVGWKGSMRERIFDEVQTAIICNRAPFDVTALWMTVTAVGDLAAIDGVLEALLFLNDAQEASVDQMSGHMQQWKKQRASTVDRLMLLSLQSRGARSPLLDSLLAQAASQPSVHPDKPRHEQRVHAEDTSSTSPLASPTVPTSSEPCSRYLIKQCDDTRCRCAHIASKPYCAWLAECLCCRNYSIRQLRYFERHFVGIFSQNSGLPAQPLLVALPVPSTIVWYRALRQGGPLVESLQQRCGVFINMPRADRDVTDSHPWGMLRARGDTRQVDAIIEWLCWLMDDWKVAGCSTNSSEQYKQAERLGAHLERWMKRRAKYVAEHGEVLYAFVSHGLGAQIRLSFTLPVAAADDGHRCASAGSGPTEGAALAVDDSSDHSSPPTSSISPSSQQRSSSNSNSISSSSSLLDTPPARASSSPHSAILPLDPAQQLESMRATGRLLGYTSFIQHPSFSATAQPFIRVLPDQSFACWPIPAGRRETFVWTLDEEAMPLSKFEEKWGVDVYVPSATGSDAGNGNSMEWCNVCVRMKLDCKERSEVSDAAATAAVSAEKRTDEAMHAVMLAVMRRAERVVQLMTAS